MHSQIFLARHGQTAWSISGQHTGRADIPLTNQGERNARSLGARLKGLSFVKVLTSPLQRAKRTCELAGFGTVATVDPDLMEWNYGQYEGKRTVEIRQERPDWNLFREGWPAAETLAAVSARADGPERAGIRSLDFYQPPQGLCGQVSRWFRYLWSIL